MGKRLVLLVSTMVAFLVSVAGVAYAASTGFNCNIPAFGNYFCAPAFDMPPGRYLYVRQNDTDPERDFSYAAFNMTSTGCNGTQLNGYSNYVSDGTTVRLGYIRRDWDKVCVKANANAGSGPVNVTGSYIR